MLSLYGKNPPALSTVDEKNRPKASNENTSSGHNYLLMESHHCLVGDLLDITAAPSTVVRALLGVPKNIPTGKIIRIRDNRAIL